MNLLKYRLNERMGIQFYMRTTPGIGTVQLSSLAEPLNSSGKGRKRSIGKRLLTLSAFTLIGGGSLLYYSKTVRDYARENIKEFDDFLNLAEDTASKYNLTSFFDKKPENKSELTHIPKTDPNKPANFFIDKLESKDETIVKTKEKIPEAKLDDDILATYDDVESVIKKQAENLLHTNKLQKEDLVKLASLARTYVETAISDYKQADKVAVAYLEKLKGPLSFSKSDNKDADLTKMQNSYDAYKSKLSKSTESAKHQLKLLHDAITMIGNVSDPNDYTILQSTLRNYKDLLYQLDNAIISVKRTDANIETQVKHRNSYFQSWGNIDTEVKNIASEVSKVAVDAKSAPKEVNELNALLMTAYNRIAALEKLFSQALHAAQVRNESDTAQQEAAQKALLKDALVVELTKQRNEFEIEKIRMIQKSDERVEEELSLALARHSEHLAQMLRLKEQEMNHSAKQRLREAIADERKNFEASIRTWTQRMEVLDRVVQSKADIDTVAKHAQAYWLAVESLASTVVFPPEDLLKDPVDNAIESILPLKELFESIREVCQAMTEDTSRNLVHTVLNNVPKSVSTEGFWTAPALKERFDRVYNSCRRVVYINDTDPSLWQYLSSWLRSTLTFDLGRRTALWTRINQIMSVYRSEGYTLPYVIDRTTDIIELSQHIEENQMIILDSARLAVERGDLEFALKLMLQLKGHPRELARDWCEATRVHLEVLLIAQTLMAHASATGITAFQQRL